MRIQLTEKDIVKGILLYVQALGISMEGKEHTISFTAGRGTRGLSADLSITEVKTHLSDVVEVKSSPSLTLEKDDKDDVVSRTPGIPSIVGNETQVPVEQGVAVETKKAVSLFG